MTVSETRILRIDKELCVGCGCCQESCPLGAISIRSGIAVIDQTRCKGCGICIDACPRGAIVKCVLVSRKKLAVTVSELKQRTDDILARIERLS